MLKHTPESNPDHIALVKALNKIKEIMTYINENKRKTEVQVAIFNIFREIDNCPPNLVSAQRYYICKCDVMEKGDELSGRGDQLVLFLFSDSLEICKKKSKASYNAVKSPYVADKNHPLRHIQLISLNSIKKVIDIKEKSGMHISIFFIKI